MGLRLWFWSTVTLPALALLPGCPAEPPSTGTDSELPPMTTAGDTTTGAVDGTTATSVATEDASGPSTGGSSSTGNGFGGIFDVGTIADLEYVDAYSETWVLAIGELQIEE